MSEDLPAPHEDIPPYMDEAAYTLPGTPGYRTRPGRSGLDYLDSEFELARMEGIFLRRLFTGRLSTSTPVYLYGMGILGVLCVAPAFIGLLSRTPFDGYTMVSWCNFAVLAVLGVALLVNFSRNLGRK